MIQDVSSGKDPDLESVKGPNTSMRKGTEIVGMPEADKVIALVSKNRTWDVGGGLKCLNPLL